MARRSRVAVGAGRRRRDPVEPGDRWYGAGRSLCGVARHALSGGHRRGGVWAGRAVDALGHVPGRSPRPRDVVVLSRHPGRQRTGVCDRWAGGGCLGLARSVPRSGDSRTVTGHALLLHARAATTRRNRTAPARPRRRAARPSIRYGSELRSRAQGVAGHPVVRALLRRDDAEYVRAGRGGGVVRRSTSSSGRRGSSSVRRRLRNWRTCDRATVRRSFRKRYSTTCAGWSPPT